MSKDDLAGMDQNAVAIFMANMAASRKERKANPGTRSSSLQKRIQREKDAFYYGDGRRNKRAVQARTMPPSAMTQLNCRVPFALKLDVQAIAEKFRVSMLDVVIGSLEMLKDQDDATMERWISKSVQEREESEKVHT